MGQGKFLFESCPGSINGWGAFPDFKIVGKYPCFLDELLDGRDDLFWFFGMAVGICVVHSILYLIEQNFDR